MIDRWLAIHSDPRLKALSAAQRVAAANGILLAESGGAAPTSPSAPTRWFEVTDFGLQSEEWLQTKLALEAMDTEAGTGDLDRLMVIFAESFGKVVTPIDPAVPPFYLINGQRESIYELRLRVKAMFDDNWNVMSRNEVVARLRANNDTVQEL